MIYGFLIDFIFRNKEKKESREILDLCEKEHSHVEKGIIKSSLKHTINVFIYIFILTLILNVVIGVIGEEVLGDFMGKTKLFEPIISSLIGLIPNCASSVIITELYLSGIISFGSLIAGLLVNSGTRYTCII